MYPMADNIETYCTYTWDDIMKLPDDCWIIFGGDDDDGSMSTGPFISEDVARDCNKNYLEWEWASYITAKEFKDKLRANNNHELEPFGDVYDH